jgi:hypothetical protein
MALISWFIRGYIHNKLWQGSHWILKESAVVRLAGPEQSTESFP